LEVLNLRGLVRSNAREHPLLRSEDLKDNRAEFAVVTVVDLGAPEWVICNPDITRI
jgi:hypothetical protein